VVSCGSAWLAGPLTDLKVRQFMLHLFQIGSAFEYANAVDGKKAAPMPNALLL
jgi:hypothetical protein